MVLAWPLTYPRPPAALRVAGLAGVGKSALSKRSLVCFAFVNGPQGRRGVRGDFIPPLFIQDLSKTLEES